MTTFAYDTIYGPPIRIDWSQTSDDCGSGSPAPAGATHVAFDYDARGVARIPLTPTVERPSEPGPQTVRPDAEPRSFFAYDEPGFPRIESVRGVRTNMTYDAVPRPRAEPGTPADEVLRPLAVLDAVLRDLEGPAARYRFDDSGRGRLPPESAGGRWNLVYDGGRPLAKTAAEGEADAPAVVLVGPPDRAR